MGFLFGVQYGLICSIMFYLGRCELNPSIQWTHSNPLFTINRTHCVNPLSRVFFICPNTVTILTRLKTSQSSPQYENLWLVGKQGFEGCEVNKSIDKKLIDCNNPLNLLYYEVIFKRYSAVMSAPVFEPGREYYFIATSDGTRSSLDKTSGGRCSSHTMKLKFYVCTNNTDPRCQSDDLCNGIVPTHAPTTANTAKPTTTSTQSTPATTYMVKNTSSTAYIVPTSRIKTTVAANPGQERERSFKETTYFIAIGGLVFLCVLLIIVSVFSIYRLNRNSTRKSRSPSAQLV